jgi:hypothetical protein
MAINYILRIWRRRLTSLRLDLSIDIRRVKWKEHSKLGRRVIAWIAWMPRITTSQPNNPRYRNWHAIYLWLILRSVLAYVVYIFFFGFEETSSPRKAHFVGPDERVKPRLSQVFTRDARPDSNSRPAMQISNPLPLR